jgi:sulfate transport system ATP-binding protein
VIDRPDGRRILAATTAGETVEVDVPPETLIAPRDNGFITIERARVFSTR